MHWVKYIVKAMFVFFFLLLKKCGYWKILRFVKFFLSTLWGYLVTYLF